MSSRLSRNWRLIVGLIVIALLVLLYQLGQSRFGNPFARYIAWPVPSSVSEVRCQSNERWLFAIEPIVYISFTANAADVDKIVKKGFAKASRHSAEFMGQRYGPPWWSPGPIDAKSRVYVRKRWRGDEYLRIDESGTNCFYLLWGV